jgi:hypothetical protein
MTTHPNTLDRGIPIKDRLWRLNTETAHLPRDFSIDNATSVHLLVLRREQVGKLTSFDSFARSDPIASNTESVLQLFMRASSQLRRRYLDARNTGSDSNYPFHAYLEVVFESDEAREARLSMKGDTDAGVFNIRHQVMRDVLDYTQDELDAVQRAQSGIIDHTLTTFMSEIDGGREVIEYRIWFICVEQVLHFTSALNDILYSAFNMHEKRILPATIAQEDRVLMKQQAALAANGELRSHLGKMSAIAGDDERWTLFESMEAYLTFVAAYTGQPNYCDQSVINASLNSHKDLNDPANPANPNNVYSPVLYFSRDLRHIYAAQASLDSYCTSMPHDKYRWTFPMTSCVIAVPSEYMNVSAFCRKMTPDHQARVVQPRLSRAHYQPISRLRGSSLFRQVMESVHGDVNALKRGEAAPLNGERATAAAAVARAAKPIDPLEEARAAMVTAEEAGADTDDEAADERENEMIDELEDLNLSEQQKTTVRLFTNPERFDKRKKAMVSEVGNKYQYMDPQRLSVWPKTQVPSEYEVDDETTMSELTDSSATRSGRNTLLLSIDSNGERSRSSIVETHRQRLATFDFGDPNTRKQERQVSEIAKGSSGMTALDTLNAHYRHHLPAERRKIVDERQALLRYTTDQDAAFAEYSDKCMSSTSSISPTGCSINRFWEQRKGERKDFIQASILMADTRLATFGLLVSQMALDYDKACSVYAAHREAIVMTFCACDTYRHEYNLHLNPVFVGEAAVSKSFVIELLEKLGIEGTIRSINSKTRAAANISESRDDVMDAYQEMNSAWLCVSTGPNARPDQNQVHDQFKERVGTCRVTTEYFHMTADGRRTSMLAHSSQIGNFVGATNLKIGEIAPPMLSRVWCVVMLAMRSDNGDLAETDAISRAQAQVRVVMEMMDGVQHDYRMMQFYHYHVEKLIYIGALTEPSLPVFGVYMPIFRRTLREKFGISVPIRTMFRLEKFLRQLVIREALWRAFVLPSAPFHGKPFNINQLKYLDPLLRDNQKMVFWLFEFAMDQYVDVYETMVTDQIRAHIEGRYTDSRLFEKLLNQQSQLDFGDSNLELGGAQRAEPKTGVYASTVLTSHNGADYSGNSALQQASVGMKRPTDNLSQGRQIIQAAARSATLDATYNAAAQQHEMRRNESAAKDVEVASFAPSGLSLVSASSQARFDWRYVKIPGTLADMVTRLQHNMKNAVRQLSRDQIKDELVSLTKKTIKTRKYIQDPRHGESGHPYPVMIDQSDVTEDRVFAIVIAWQSNTILIASALLFNEWQNPATAVVQQCFDRFSMPNDVYLSGFSYRPDTPSLFAVEPMQTRQKTHVILNAAALDASVMKWVRGGTHYAAMQQEVLAAKRTGRRLPPWLASETFVINAHIDQFATRVRLHRIALPWDNVDLIKKFDPMLADLEWKQSVEHVGNYPEQSFKDLMKTDRGKDIRETVQRERASQLAKNAALEKVTINDVMATVTNSKFTARTEQQVPSLALGARYGSGGVGRSGISAAVHKKALQNYRILRDAAAAREYEIAKATEVAEEIFSERPTKRRRVANIVSPVLESGPFAGLTLGEIGEEETVN